MRNDVKLGFAIGGVLLAVLIVYVLVVPGNSQSEKQVATNQSLTSGLNKPMLEPIVPATQPSAPPVAPPQDFTPPAPGQAVPGQDDAALVKKDAQALPPSIPSASSTPDATSGQASASSAQPGTSGKDIDWNKLLNAQPTLIAQTPVSVDSAQVVKVTDLKPAPMTDDSTQRQANDAPAANDGSEIDPPPTLIGSEPSDAKRISADPKPGSAGLTARGSQPPRTHVVQAHETLSTIAAAAYGNPNLYPAILRANPGVDANRLKVGATLNLPPLSEVKPSGSDAQSASGTIKPAKKSIDSARQYVVKSGDSLYRISVSLYGKSTLADRLYALNKQVIGDDPTRLKIGQVLNLPQAPTVTGAAAR